MQYEDRADAGRRLAGALGTLKEEHPVVLGLPRGGVPVAAEVARTLAAPLDVIVVRKIGVPGQPELALGAVGEGGSFLLNSDVVALAGVPPTVIDRMRAEADAEVERRVARLRAGRPRVRLQGRTAIIVDDGVATGATALAACGIARAQGAGRVVLAVPVGPAGWEERFTGAADEIVCLREPSSFVAVGQWYRDFAQVSDEAVAEELRGSQQRRGGSTGRSTGSSAAPGPLVHREVEIALDDVVLSGELVVPPDAQGVVVFAHGSGSSRHSPRNRHVAAVLNEAGFATLLFDLLSPLEESDRTNVFDVDLLGGRLSAVTEWISGHAGLVGVPVGYFGASTGAAAALWAAAQQGAKVAAVVSRGGRPDLAMASLARVGAPTLLIVGGNDPVVLELNERAAQRLRCEKHVAVVPGATHLFAEPGKLEVVAEMAADWFGAHLAQRPADVRTT